MNYEKENLKKLNEKILKLQDCQKNKNIDSCLKCDSVIGCETRKNYVDSIYSSMNSGKDGFFNFETE